MEISKAVLDQLSLDRTRFDKIRNSEFRPSFDIFGLKYLRDKARNERDLRELYRDRAPYELLQNADDAGAKRVAFILSSEGLAFVHDGRWFTIGNFRSLADGWSDKDPNQCIGHKGLGFRSVLDITPAPHLLKVDPKELLGIKFTWPLNNGHIQEALQRDPGLRAHYEDWTRHGQRCCPVMAIPGIAKKETLGVGWTILNALIQGNYKGQFTTMFWFPEKDPDIDKKVFQEISPIPIVADWQGRERLQRFLRDDVCVYLPFLKSLVRVDVYENRELIGSVSMRVADPGNKDGEIAVISQTHGSSREESFFQRRFRFVVPPQIRNKPDTPIALKRMEQVGVTLSVRLENAQPTPDDYSRFHVYYPTDERTGVGFIIHGDFYVKPDRTRLKMIIRIP